MLFERAPEARADDPAREKHRRPQLRSKRKVRSNVRSPEPPYSRSPKPCPPTPRPSAPTAPTPSPAGRWPSACLGLCRTSSSATPTIPPRSTTTCAALRTTSPPTRRSAARAAPRPTATSGGAAATREAGLDDEYVVILNAENAITPHSEALWDTLGGVLEAAAGERRPGERLREHLVGALWGNRMDRSVQQSLDQGTAAADAHLLANDCSAAIDHLLAGEPGAVHVLMDNAGTEEALDLATADCLLEADLARQVVLHVKMQPVLVSDATGRDVLAMLEAMAERGGRPEALAERLNGHLQTGRLRLAPDFFWSTAGRLWELPPRLHESLADAQLVIGKGDVNYRRATHDAVWPAGATLAEAVKGFPAPLLSLRTIKSDTLVGVDAETTERLDAEHEHNWRTTGTYAVAQFAE
ncbi:MAG: hypothetical protein BRD38_05785 [Bacteroidetes bacterium QH_9_67_14]|nr:MAG: hypothetical protein BRD38_05785 [Bacteroidetes bacterium QH_9_67_14]